jgi:zinc transport system substrate-binding protein
VSLASLVLLLITITFLGCSGGEETGLVERDATPEKRSHLSVYAVNYPLQYFAERIGGTHLEVSFPAPPETDPAYWSPDAETIAAYQSADLILLNGAGYAQWVELASLPQARLVDTSAAFRDRYIPMEEGAVHTHGPEGEHSHKGYAFTTWLDPTLAIEQARAIAASFSEARLGEAVAFQAAFEELENDLLQLDERLTEVAESLGNQPLLFSHPVYQYLARRYDLNSRLLHWEPDQEPDEEMWRELEELFETHPTRWMIWEDEPLETTARRLEEHGIASLVYRPSANVPPEGDLLSVLQADLASLEAATR